MLLFNTSFSPRTAQVGKYKRGEGRLGHIVKLCLKRNRIK
jgi:hypothetical protein